LRKNFNLSVEGWLHDGFIKSDIPRDMWEQGLVEGLLHGESKQYACPLALSWKCLNICELGSGQYAICNARPLWGELFQVDADGAVMSASHHGHGKGFLVRNGPSEPVR